MVSVVLLERRDPLFLGGLELMEKFGSTVEIEGHLPSCVSKLSTVSVEEISLFTRTETVRKA